jgi:hypothetical protein
LDFANDPFSLALLSEYPSKPSIIRRPPEYKVAQEKWPRDRIWQKEEKEQLHAKKAQVQQVEMAFRVGWMEQSCQDIMRRRNAKNYFQ